MFASLLHRVQFLVERFLVRGPLFRLLFIVATVVSVSIVGGLAVVGTGEFESTGAAIWWAFLRLSDPGYLGDDQGLYVRAVSTVLTVAGYVLFLGAMVAIMTQWLNAALRRLENGLTPIADRDHFVVMGWTTRTPNIVQELLESGDRVRMFLRLRRTRALRVVVMAEEVDAALQQDLRERVGPVFSSSNVILRSGSSLRTDHLLRVAALDAAAVLLPAAVGPAATVADTHMIKALLSLNGFIQQHDPSRAPLVVAELLDTRKAITARRAYAGPLELIASNHVVSSLICQTIRHPGLSHVYASLLSHGEGSEIYARECPQFAGMRFGDLPDAFPEAVLLGVVRRDAGCDRSLLNPSDDLVLDEHDRLVLIAEQYTETTPPADYRPRHSDRGHGVPQAPDLAATRRILVLGWNHHVPALMTELDSYQAERFEIVVASVFPLDKRLRQIDSEVVLDRVSVQHLEIDYTIPGQLKRLAPGEFDNIVLVANDWIESEEADARTILGHLLLREIVPDDSECPSVLVELSEPSNLSLFQRGRSEVIIPPMILSHIMAQVALRRELRVVFDDMFGPEGTEIFFRSTDNYDLCGREVDFAEIRRAAARHNETALGLRLRRRSSSGDDEVLINPPRDRKWTLDPRDALVVLANCGS